MATLSKEAKLAQPSPPAAESREPPPFDYAAAIARLGNDTNLFDDMAGFFRSDSPELLQRIRAAIDASDANEVLRAAHSLKGLAATFDAKAAVAAALRVEELGRSGNLAEIESASWRFCSSRCSVSHRRSPISRPYARA